MTCCDYVCFTLVTSVSCELLKLQTNTDMVGHRAAAKRQTGAACVLYRPQVQSLTLGVAVACRVSSTGSRSAGCVLSCHSYSLDIQSPSPWQTYWQHTNSRASTTGWVCGWAGRCVFDWSVGYAVWAGAGPVWMGALLVGRRAGGRAADGSCLRRHVAA